MNKKNRKNRLVKFRSKSGGRYHHGELRTLLIPNQKCSIIVPCILKMRSLWGKSDITK